MSSELEVRQTEAVEIRRGGLLDVQRRYRQLGRLRTGDSKGNKGAPRKLKEWRITSPSDELMRCVAELYGGEVQVWEGAPTEGTQYEVYTGTDRLDVLVAPGEPLTQAWELWSGGGCERRCNGVAQTTGEPCACPADIEERLELAKTGKACKATTRLSVVLPRIPDIGVWRVDSHGMNAAVELPGTVDLLRMALEAGQPIPAQLRIEQRTSKKDGVTRHFNVPVLELPSITIQSLMSGQVTPAIAAAHAAELSVPSTPALEAPKPTAAPAAKAPAAKKATNGARRPSEAPPLPTDDPAPAADAAPPSAPKPPVTKHDPTSIDSPFQRVVLTRGKAVGLEGGDLDAMVAFVIDKPTLTDISEPGEGNSVLAALKRFSDGELVLSYREDGSPYIEEAGK